MCSGCWRGARVIPAGSSVWWTLLGRYRFGRGLHPVPTQQPAGTMGADCQTQGGLSCHSLAAHICSYTQTGRADAAKSWKSDFGEPVHCLDWTTFNERLRYYGHTKMRFDRTINIDRGEICLPNIQVLSAVLKLYQFGPGLLIR